MSPCGGSVNNLATSVVALGYGVTRRKQREARCVDVSTDSQVSILLYHYAQFQHEVFYRPYPIPSSKPSVCQVANPKDAND